MQAFEESSSGAGITHIKAVKSNIRSDSHYFSWNLSAAAVGLQIRCQNENDREAGGY
jgi:hypothetical protein